MVRRRVVSNAQLEPIAIAVEIREIPLVEPVAPSVNFLHRHRRAEHEQIQAVVDVVPQACVAEHIALAGTFFAREAVRAFAVLAGVAVAVGVQVDDGIVGRGALQLESGFVVVVRDEGFVVVVRGVAGVDAVGAVDQSVLVN